MVPEIEDTLQFPQHVRRPARDRIRIVLSAPDPLSQAGVAAMLGSRDVLLLPLSRVLEAQVLVVVAEELSEAFLEEVLPAGPGSVPVILVLDEPQANPRALAQMGVVACIWRNDISQQRLLDEIFLLHAASESEADTDSGNCGQAASQTRTPGRTRAGAQARLTEDLNRIRSLAASAAPAHPRLSGRDIEVLRLVAQGLDTAEIAVRVQYSERTVKGILHGITQRLDLLNRPHAVAYAMRAGVL